MEASEIRFQGPARLRESFPNTVPEIFQEPRPIKKMTNHPKIQVNVGD